MKVVIFKAVIIIWSLSRVRMPKTGLFPQIREFCWTFWRDGKFHYLFGRKIKCVSRRFQVHGLWSHVDFVDFVYFVPSKVDFLTFSGNLIELFMKDELERLFSSTDVTPVYLSKPETWKKSFFWINFSVLDRRFSRFFGITFYFIVPIS